MTEYSWLRNFYINRHRPANIWDIFLTEKWLKNCSCLWNFFFIEKDPFEGSVSVNSFLV